MIKVAVQVDTAVLDAISETAQRAPKLMATVYRRSVAREKGRILKRLLKRPPPIQGKVKWASAKQRCAFYASDGFGGGIPHVPANPSPVLEGYDVRVEASDNGGVITIENSYDKATYIVGADAQPFLIDRWPQIVDVAIEAEAELNSILIEDWLTVSDPFAGVKP